MIITLMMEAAGCCEKAVNFFYTLCRGIPEDSHLPNVAALMQ
jgi:hypothetical protein